LLRPLPTSIRGEPFRQVVVEFDMRRQCFGDFGKRAPVCGATLAVYNMHEIRRKVNIGKLSAK